MRLETITNHGTRLLIYNFYEYVLRSGRPGVWRCVTRLCNARLLMSPEGDIKDVSSHKHAPISPAKIEARLLAVKAKKLIQQVGVTPRDAMNSILTGAKEEVLAEVAGLDSFLRRLRNHRSDNKPLTVENFTEKNKGSVLYDSGLENKRRLVIVGQKEEIPKVEEAVTLYFDSSLPPKVRTTYHLYRVHAKVGDPPSLFVLLSHKDQDLIFRMFRAIAEIVPKLRPSKIITDMQHYTLAAAKLVFPMAHAKVCYLRFSELVIRKINSIGLKSLYDQSEESREFLKSITSLAFVRPQDVRMVFHLYISDYPDSKSHLKFIKYFKDTFIGTDTEQPSFPIEWWNHYVGVLKLEPTTSKSNEGFLFTKKLTEIVKEYHFIDKREYLKMLTHI